MKVPTISSSRTSSESWRDRSSAGGTFLARAGAPLGGAVTRFCFCARLPAAGFADFWRARSAIGRALVEIEDLRRAHVGLGLVAGDLADLAHDLGHALGLAQDD